MPRRLCLWRRRPRRRATTTTTTTTTNTVTTIVGGGSGRFRGSRPLVAAVSGCSKRGRQHVAHRRDDEGWQRNNQPNHTYRGQVVDKRWRHVGLVLSRDKNKGNMSTVENTSSNDNGDSGWEAGGVSDAATNETEEARLRREISRDLRMMAAATADGFGDDDGPSPPQRKMQQSTES